MRIAINSLKGLGGTFMEWSLYYLTNCNKGKMYNFHKGWLPVVDNPVRMKDAHGHQKSHPIWEYTGEPIDEPLIKEFLEATKDLKGVIPFYPYVDGRWLGTDLYKVNEDMIRCLYQNDVKIFLIQPTVPYPYFSERSFQQDKDSLIFLRVWLKDQLASVKKIRELSSFRIITNAKKYLGGSRNYHDKVAPMVMDTFIDVEWQSNPEECMKTMCDKLDLEILPDRLTKWRPIADKWVMNNKKFSDWYEKEVSKINSAIVGNKKMALPELNIMHQIVIMAHLMRDHGKRLILPSDDFPLDTQMLHGLLK